LHQVVNKNIRVIIKTKAAVNTKYGPPEVDKVMEMDKTYPKDNEVLTKVYAATVNRTGCGFSSQIIELQIWKDHLLSKSG
jgi:hypothetical protein